MTYSLEGYIEKIKSPIICYIDGKRTEYKDGLALLKVHFDKYYLVASITHSEKAVVLELEENKRNLDTSWIGEEEVSFF